MAKFAICKMVAREGLEPSKPLGRQIYSLLRLTASLPRQLSVLVECDAFGLTLWTRQNFDRWSWRRELNPRPADYKSAALPTELRQPEQNVNFSTSYARRATHCRYWLWARSAVAGNLLLYSTALPLPTSFEERDAGRH